MDGDRLIAGHPFLKSTYTDEGKVTFWNRANGVWTQAEGFLSENAGAGSGQGGRLGYAVTIAGVYAIAGAYGEDHGGYYDRGRAYVFKQTGGVWNRSRTLIHAGASAEVR